MLAHAADEDLQERACGVLRNLTTSSVQNESRAFNAGAIEAVVTAMSVRADCALMLETASVAMRSLTGGNVKYTARAGVAGAVEALVEAMRRHTES